MGSVLIAVGVTALLANLFAFLTAFGVSFLGHHFYSFQGHGAPATTTLKRFAVVAIIGFLINEGLLLALLNPLENTPILALALSTLSAAALTFVLSKKWAFRLTFKG